MIRTATLRDLSTLVRHRAGMFRDLGIDSARTDDRRYRDWVRARLKSGSLIGFVAGKAASGCVWLQPVQPRPGGRTRLPYLLSMYTEPEFRGRGLATKIVAAAMRWCRARGFGKMSLHASPMGRRVYTKLGWRRTWEMRVELA